MNMVSISDGDARGDERPGRIYRSKTRKAWYGKVSAMAGGGAYHSGAGVRPRVRRDGEMNDGLAAGGGGRRTDVTALLNLCIQNVTAN
jgi:hypothetical protein